MRAPSRIVSPSAAALIGSLRGIGYSLKTAIADLIDNSITAGAAVVEVTFEWGGGVPRISILDNGRGMTDSELELAMRFGGAGPHQIRDAADLGRFGLGLKTASLSQCRRLTVASLQAGRCSVLRWDLDYIRDVSDAWELLEGAAPGSEACLKALSSRPAGTLVIWELVDFGRRDDVIGHPGFLEGIGALEKHLALVFHRFLNGDARQLTIRLNGQKVVAWDPFLENHPSTRRRPEQALGSGTERVMVRGFTLPHRDRFRDEGEYLAAGGPAGWNAQQGFYIYRNKRLLAGGGWLGLGGSRVWTREESSRLGRIRVDIPNTVDQDWNIDVKKSVARPPASLRQRLSMIAEDIRSNAREVFVHRGSYGPRSKSEEIERIWEPAKTSDRVGYRIRRTHPAVVAATPTDAAERAAFNSLLTLTERTVPVDRIWLDVTEKPGSIQANQISGIDPDLAEAARGLGAMLMRKGLSKTAAAEKVSRLDPYDTIPGFAEMLALNL
ncbi:ATP-binding protein [Lichenicola sp.]|uniref:ATP-binding protein n=1 Tax=Lichenicola sp. TaxID=2804529 RepID=UPI003AFFA820